ncbi:MAG: NADPH-dependent F420 reductase [Thermoplasmatota archaeon]
MPQTLKIGFIGKGKVGSALSEGLQNAGYQVQASGRNPKVVKDVAAWADVVFLAVPHAERMNAIRAAGDGLRGKIVVDVTNPIGPSGPQINPLKSSAEEIQAALGDAKVVKAFNTVFASSMTRGNLHGEKLAALVAGTNPNARKTVVDLAKAIGFDGIEAGPIENARYLEALGLLNINLGFQQGLGTEVGFRLVRPPTRQTTDPAAAGARGR